MTDVHALHIPVPGVTAITDAWIPHTVHIPLYCRESDGLTFPEPGTVVQEGQVLKAAENGHPAVMSSVPGVITGYQEFPLYDGGRSLYAIIRTEGAFTYFGRGRTKKTVETLTALELSGILNTHGVYNTFDHSVPFADQVRPFQRQIQIDEEDSHGKSVTVLAVRLFDEDPVSIAGSVFSEHYFDLISEGIRIVTEVIHASYVYIFYPAGSAFFEEGHTIDGMTANLQFLPVSLDTYPCGRERDLRKQLKKAGFSHADDHILFTDGRTMYATALAAVYDQPVLETLVQISGSALSKDRLFKVRNGTPIGELAAQCGGLKHLPQKIIVNGLVRGYAVADPQVPVTPQVVCVTIPAKSDIPDQRELNCIRCGRCHRSCAAGIHPDKMLFFYSRHQKMPERLEKLIWQCNDCRECNTACPARLPLAQTIMLLREELSHE
ncbi:MAG: hypothetical protein MJ178_00300 [Treponemataceae bacterium]|nr:hypothetical protein [Treponemataceae bacterium]